MVNWSYFGALSDGLVVVGERLKDLTTGGLDQRFREQKNMTKQVAQASYGQRFPLPHCYSLLSRKNEVNGAAAPEGPMTYDST